MKNTFGSEQDKLWGLGLNVARCADASHFDSLIQEINRVSVRWSLMKEKRRLTDAETGSLAAEARDLRELVLMAKAARAHQ